MLDRIDPVAAFLEFDGTRIDGVPVFDAPASGTDGIVGALGAAGSAAAIGVEELSPQAVYTGEYRTLCSASYHAALAVICQGAHPGLGLLNAEKFRHPYGCPAIHVSSEAPDAVLGTASRGATARLVAHSKRVAASASNVVLSIAGRDRSRPPLVVIRPMKSRSVVLHAHGPAPHGPDPPRA